jgi:hypothetical protein
MKRRRCSLHANAGHAGRGGAGGKAPVKVDSEGVSRRWSRRLARLRHDLSDDRQPIGASPGPPRHQRRRRQRVGADPGGSSG